VHLFERIFLAGMITYAQFSVSEPSRPLMIMPSNLEKCISNAAPERQAVA
jgi:hypothetical protein